MYGSRCWILIGLIYISIGCVCVRPLGLGVWFVFRVDEVPGSIPGVDPVLSASGLVVKSNVAIVGPRVRFSAGAWTFLFIYPFLVYFIYRLKPPTHTCPFHVQLSISVSMAMRLGIINPCHSFATRWHCHWSPSTPPSHPPLPPSAPVTSHKGYVPWDDPPCSPLAFEADHRAITSSDKNGGN